MKLERTGSPWFLAVGFRRPHLPLMAPAAYFELHANDRVRLPPIDAASLARIPDIALTYRRSAETAPPAVLRARIEAYRASVSFLDAQVGVLIDALDRSGAAAKTIVVFTSDHGYHLGEHDENRKMTLFEESVRVPLVIDAPDGKPGKTRALVELIDLYPTVAELAGLQPRPDLDGASLVPVLANPRKVVKTGACSELLRSNAYNERGQRDWEGHLDPAQRGESIRTSRWRYTRWFDGSRELYDHRHDPGEQHNLASEQGRERLMATLEKLGGRQCGWSR